jgi:hypothetical protein
MAKSGQLGVPKLRIGDKGWDLSKRGLSLVVALMCRVPCGQPGVTSRTVEQCRIMSGGGF